MHRALVPSLAVAAVLACAATAAAQAPTLSPQVATAGQPFPSGLAGWAQSLTGRSVRTVPAGWTVSTWTFDLAPGASATLDLACPTGKAIATIGPDGSPAPLTVTVTPSNFIPFYGSTGPTVTATASSGQPGTGTFMTACLPSAKARTTTVRGRSPVTFRASDEAVGLRKGAQIPRSWRVYKSTLRNVGRDGVVVDAARGCPGDTQQNEHAVSVPAARGQALPGGGFALAPSAKLAKGPVTVYTLCSSLNE
jgi:hypothetical protein